MPFGVNVFHLDVTYEVDWLLRTSFRAYLRTASTSESFWTDVRVRVFAEIVLIEREWLGGEQREV